MEPKTASEIAHELAAFIDSYRAEENDPILAVTMVDKARFTIRLDDGSVYRISVAKVQ